MIITKEQGHVFLRSRVAFQSFLKEKGIIGWPEMIYISNGYKILV